MSRKRPRPKGLKKRVTRVYDEETRLRALELAEEVGPMQAARDLGIPPSTLKRWRGERGLSGPPSSADPDAWAKAKREGASETWTTAKSALDRVKALLADGEENKAKSAALVMAILLDKSAALEQASALAEERRVKLANAQVDAIASALMTVFDDLGLPRSQRVGALLAYRLATLEDPDAPQDEPPEIEAAREELYTHLRGQWEKERQEPIAELLPPSDEVKEEAAIDVEIVEESESTVWTRGRFRKGQPGP